MILDQDAINKLKERNCGNCLHRNEKYKILGCDLRNKQVKKHNSCSSHQFDRGAAGKVDERDIKPTSSEICKCGKGMNFLKQRTGDDEEIFAYRCIDEDCGNIREIHVCETCEHESKWDNCEDIYYE